MIYFTTRQAARNFANGRKVQDCKNAPSVSGKRWGVKVTK